MRATVDSGGRVLLPKQLRDSLGITAGMTVDISAYGDGLRITPGGRVAVLARDDRGHLVATSDQPITDETVFGLIDAGRR